jgi:hypothetical protein
MFPEKNMLSLEEIDAQCALELPKRELLTPPMSIVQSLTVIQAVPDAQAGSVTQSLAVTQIVTAKQRGPVHMPYERLNITCGWVTVYRHGPPQIAFPCVSDDAN